MSEEGTQGDGGARGGATGWGWRRGEWKEGRNIGLWRGAPDAVSFKWKGVRGPRAGVPLCSTAGCGAPHHCSGGPRQHCALPPPRMAESRPQRVRARSSLFLHVQVSQPSHRAILHKLPSQVVLLLRELPFRPASSSKVKSHFPSHTWLFGFAHPRIPPCRSAFLCTACGFPGAKANLVSHKLDTGWCRREAAASWRAITCTRRPSCW